LYGPETSVTERTGDMGDNLVPNGLSEGRKGFLFSRLQWGHLANLPARGHRLLAPGDSRVGDYWWDNGFLRYGPPMQACHERPLAEPIRVR
jgi:hypothetical protein